MTKQELLKLANSNLHKVRNHVYSEMEVYNFMREIVKGIELLEETKDTTTTKPVYQD